MKTWLITGGCGFIGLNLINKLLLQDDVRIIVLDDLSVCDEGRLPFVEKKVDLSCDSGTLGKIEEKIILIKCDIANQHETKKIIVHADVLVHLAANTGVGPSVEDPFFDMQSNVIGTVNMLELARVNNIPKFIFASSGAPAGNVVPPITENIVPKPISPYGASKLAGEGYCSAYFNSFGVNTVALRFSNVYGPRSEHKNSVVAKFIKQALSNLPYEIFGNQHVFVF